MANVYVSGAIAIAAEVLSNHRMQQKILTEFHERPLFFVIRLLLPLNKPHKCSFRFWSKT